MQPFINPNYFYQPPVIPQGTRFVNNFNEISVNDVPMDGKYALFAKSDMSEIQARCWNPQGNITILEYSLKQVPVPNNSDNVATNSNNALIQPILDEIKALSDKVDRIIPNERKSKNESTNATQYANSK